VEPDVDVVLYATGYHYTFPFLREAAPDTGEEDDGTGNGIIGGERGGGGGGGGGGGEGGGGGGGQDAGTHPHPQSTPLVSARDNCVSPLYEHVFPPHLAPSLAFIGRGVHYSPGLGCRV